MVWPSIIVIILGCTLVGNTFTSAISFSRPIARKRSNLDEGEELLQALDFLEQYDGARRPGNLDNRIDSRYLLLDDDYDDLLMPYDPSLSPNMVNMNGLPPPPFTPEEDYPLEGPFGDPYDSRFNMAIDKPTMDINRMTIGERVEQNVDFNNLLNRLVEDAIMEDMLREDAAEAAEMLEEDIADEATELSSYSSEPEVNYAAYDGNYDINAPTYTTEDNYDYLEDSSYQNVDSYGDGDVDDEDIDKGLLEAVILRLAEGEMKQKLLEEEDDVPIEDEFNYENILEDDLSTEEEIDNFVGNIMAELFEGSQDLADKLINEIDYEKNTLDDEDMLEQEEDDGRYGEVVFSNGWDTPTLETNDVTCPALDYILDDCMIVDDFPGLGDDGYKEGFGDSCNRHQLCYFCSGTFDIPTKLCDETFKMELMSICNQDTECDFRAKYFWLSAISSRVPSQVDLSVCGEPCVVESLLDA